MMILPLIRRMRVGTSLMAATMRPARDGVKRLVAAPHSGGIKAT
jgi:hypothetical protein